MFRSTVLFPVEVTSTIETASELINYQKNCQKTEKEYVSKSTNRSIYIYKCTEFCYKGRVSTVAFSPNGKAIASGSQDGTIKLWNTRTGRCLDTMRSDRPYERMNITGV